MKKHLFGILKIQEWLRPSVINTRKSQYCHYHLNASSWERLRRFNGIHAVDCRKPAFALRPELKSHPCHFLCDSEPVSSSVQWGWQSYLAGLGKGLHDVIPAEQCQAQTEGQQTLFEGSNCYCLVSAATYSQEPTPLLWVPDSSPVKQGLSSSSQSCTDARTKHPPPQHLAPHGCLTNASSFLSKSNWPTANNYRISYKAKIVFIPWAPSLCLLLSQTQTHTLCIPTLFFPPLSSKVNQKHKSLWQL